MNIILEPGLYPASQKGSPLEKMIDDLAKSGLVYQDLLARPLDEQVKAVLEISSSTEGYVIPYFNLEGKLLPFYRAKLFDQTKGVKYLQRKGTGNHVYFPKIFADVWKASEYKFLVITEGEKKAALACKLGIPAIAFGGVDSWRNRTITIPKSSEIQTLDNALSIKLPSADFDDRWMSTYAIGLQEVLDVCQKHKTTLLICYDTDSPHGVSTNIQRAAARFGYELRFKGFPIERIRQVILPYSTKHTSGSLDTYLTEHKAEGFLQLVKENLEQRVAFPRHPSVREHISKQLQNTKIDRKQLSALSLAIITELDARGSRMYSPDDKQMFYFNADNKHLMKVDLNKPNPGQIHETEFGMLLYREYGVAAGADQRLISWLGAQFSSEDPVEQVAPHRVIARHNPRESILRYQIDNGQYIKVTSDEKAPYRILPNGAENILFESQTDGLDAKKLIHELQVIHKEHSAREHIPFWWWDVLKDVRLKKKGYYAELTALLYYISPWLLRWRGLQLPVELVLGEAGSGKSTLCTLRMEIVHGKDNADLRNTPNDQKDWYAAIANSGGLHITDNVHMTDKNLKQRISDDLCRIVTEPDPRIRIRKYFTEADERVIRINSVFGFTAIQQPFPNGDLLQRAMTLELAKAPELTSEISASASAEVVFDSYWKERQLRRFGGRERWVAHHLYVIHRLFKLADEKWDLNYKSKHRLIGFEQTLVLLAELFGLEDARKWIPKTLAEETFKNIEHADWALEGLKEFAETIRKREAKNGQKITFDCSEIASWAEDSEEYERCFQLINAKSLGRYMQANKHNVQEIAGIIEHGRKANKTMFCLKPQPQPPRAS